MAESPLAPHSSYLEAQRLGRRACNTPIRAVLAHWLGIHEIERLPDADRFRIDSLPADLLPFVFLLRRDQAEGWRVARAGAHVTAALGRDVSGCALVDEEIPNISRSRTLRLLGPLEESGLPAHFHGRSGFRFGETYDDHEQVLLPFRCGAADRIALVVGAIVYEGLRAPQS